MGLECSQCGWSQPEDGRKCPMCGARVTKSAFDAPPPAATPFQAPAPQAPAPQQLRPPPAPALAPPPRARPPAKPASRATLTIIVAAAVAGFVPIIYLVTRPDQPRPSAVVTHRAQVTRTTGAAPAAKGDPCTIRIEPAEGEPHNCRIVVQCGAKVLYGALKSNGYVHCALDAGVAISAHEAAPDDSDPDLHYDLATGQVMVKETTGTNWQVDMEIVAP